MIRSLSFLLALAFVGTSCSFSKADRQQRAYEKYVRKSSGNREKQRAHFRSNKPQMPISPMPTEPLETSETSESSPQAVPSEG